MANIVVDSYSETNADIPSELKENHPASSTYSAWGQAFTASETFILYEAKFYMKKAASPTGTAYARLYAATGTVGSTAEPTGSALASSAGFDVSTLGTDYALITFDFSGDPYELQSSSDYCIVFEAPASGTIDTTNKLIMGADTSSPSHAGNSTYYYGGAWDPYDTYDVCFYVYKMGPLEINVNECPSVKDKMIGG